MEFNSIKEVRLPALGEGITEATITRWLVKVGDMVTTETPLVEIATDKVDSEVISPFEGKVEELLLPENAVPKVGQPILRLSTQETQSVTNNPQPVLPAEVHSNGHKEEWKEKRPLVQSTQPPISARLKYEKKFVSPFVRHLAISEGITIDELYSLQGTGLDGRLTKDDILVYIKNRPKTPREVKDTSVLINQALVEENEALEIPEENAIPMDRVRKMIARNMKESIRTAAHATVFSEVDVTPMVQWRLQNKELFMAKYGEALTFTPLFVEAVAKAIKDFPGINISVKGDYIIPKANINIGMAVALPDGNLIVPVVKNADQLSLNALASQVNDLSRRARESALKPTEIQDGTFTLTNVGMFGNTTGTPIINQPQVAILAIGTIARKPAAVETEGLWGIAVRDILTLALSFDHRVVDGALGGKFLQQVCNYLANFDTTRSI